MPLAWRLTLWLALGVLLVGLLGGCAPQVIMLENSEPEYMRTMRFTMSVGKTAIMEQTWAERTPEKPARWPIQ